MSKNIRAMVIAMSQVESVNTKQTIAMEIITEEWLQIFASVIEFFVKGFLNYWNEKSYKECAGAHQKGNVVLVHEVVVIMGETDLFPNSMLGIFTGIYQIKFFFLNVEVEKY